MDLNKSVCDTCEMAKTCDIFKHYVTDRPKEKKRKFLRCQKKQNREHIKKAQD